MHVAENKRELMHVGADKQRQCSNSVSSVQMRTPAAFGRHCEGYDNRVFFDQEMRRPAQEQGSVNGEATVNLIAKFQV
jgi:hypothetical protein